MGLEAGLRRSPRDSRTGRRTDALSPSLIRVSCPSGELAPRVDRVYRDVLSRPVPRAAPGDIISLSSDGVAKSLKLVGDSTRPSCALRVFVPFRARRGDIQTKGVTRLKIRRVLEDRVISGCVDGRYEVTVAPG